MRRVNDTSVQIGPYDPCYCGSDKKVKFCHPLGKHGEIVRPRASDCKPPNPHTYSARSGCYAQQLNDCSPDMSGEHLFSDVPCWTSSLDQTAKSLGTGCPMAGGGRLSIADSVHVQGECAL